MFESRHASIRLGAQITFLALMTVLLTGCKSIPKISAIYDPNENFSQYETFAFLPKLNPQGQQYTSLSHKYLRAAIIHELQKRGLKEVPEGALLVGFYMSNKEKLATIPMAASIDSNRYWRRHGYGMGLVSGTHIIQYTEQTVTIDLISSEQKQLIWQGVAVEPLRQQQSATLATDINGVVAAIFSKYPIPLLSH